MPINYLNATLKRKICLKKQKPFRLLIGSKAIFAYENIVIIQNNKNSAAIKCGKIIKGHENYLITHKLFIKVNKNAIFAN